VEISILLPVLPLVRICFAAAELPAVYPAAPAFPFLAAAELPSLYHDSYSSQTVLRCARTGDNTVACGDSARDPLIAVREGVQAVHAANVSAADMTRTPRPVQEFDLATPPLSPRWPEHGHDNGVLDQEHSDIINAFFQRTESAIRLQRFFRARSYLRPAAQYSDEHPALPFRQCPSTPPPWTALPSSPPRRGSPKSNISE
jgi:hypothetical protein